MCWQGERDTTAWHSLTIKMTRWQYDTHPTQTVESNTTQQWPKTSHCVAKNSLAELKVRRVHMYNLPTAQNSTLHHYYIIIINTHQHNHSTIIPWCVEYRVYSLQNTCIISVSTKNAETCINQCLESLPLRMSTLAYKNHLHDQFNYTIVCIHLNSNTIHSPTRLHSVQAYTDEIRSCTHNHSLMADDIFWWDADTLGSLMSHRRSTDNHQGRKK